MITGPLDHHAIAQRIPHAGAMCLLDCLLDVSDSTVRCRISNQAEPAHPLRSPSGLLAACAIEYAAQAMALHGALIAAQHAPPTPGFLASARSVRLLVARLDDRPGPLQITATRLASGLDQALYRFELHDAIGQLLVEGRTTVVLNTPLVTSAVP